MLHGLTKASMLPSKYEHYPSVFEILKCKKSTNLIGGQDFGPELENHIFPRHAVSQNHIAYYGAHLKDKKCPRQNAKCFGFGPRLSRLPNYLGSKYNFPNVRCVHFLVYLPKRPYYESIE